MSKQTQQERVDRFVTMDNKGIIITLPESAYELLRGGDTDGNKDDDSKSSGSRK